METIARLDDRTGLLRSWLATVHSVDLHVSPVHSLPPLRVLLRTAAGWQLAYGLCAFASAIGLSRSGDTGPVARALAEGGMAAVVAGTAIVWSLAVAVASVVWWLALAQTR